MARSPKEIELRIHRILNAWQTHAPGKSFGNMTLAQFQAAVQPSLDARQRIETLEEEMRGAQTDRDAADEVSMERMQQVVNGVLADPTEGPDSAIYGGFGYTTKSDRASGLTHKSKKNTGTK